MALLMATLGAYSAKTWTQQRSRHTKAKPAKSDLNAFGSINDRKVNQP